MFLAAASDKRMCLLTSLYGIPCDIDNQSNYLHQIQILDTHAALSCYNSHYYSCYFNSSLIWVLNT